MAVLRDLFRVWRARRPVAGSVVISYVSAGASPAQIAAGVVDVLAAAIANVTRKHPDAVVQIYVERVERREQLITDSKP